LDPHAAAVHNGGAIHFGPDGKLNIATGDDANQDNPTTVHNAQRLDSLHGKVLRVNADGSVPADNPFVGTANARGEIWALGLRNPFTFAFQPGTGRMFINDVGEGTWEEIDEGGRGRNLGWATIGDGDFNPTQYPNFTRPLFTYSHPGGPGDLHGNS